MTAGPLAGFEIGITADRRADEQIKLLSSRGAECLHGPVIKTHPYGSEEDLRAATQDVIDTPPDLVVATTGVGVRSWLEAAEAIQLAEPLRAVLADTSLFARGPKATGALVTAGFEVAWTTPLAQYDEIVAELGRRGVAGQRIAIQLDGAGATDLCDRVAALGATVVGVPVYRWSLPDDSAPAERLIRAAIERRLDAVTFTAKPQIENLFEIAGLAGLTEQLVAALSTDVAVFCVGPVCAGGFVDTIYSNVFGRTPDAAGRAYWVSRLDAGTPRGVVLALLSDSPEYKQTTATEMNVVTTWFAMNRTVPSAAQVAAVSSLSPAELVDSLIHGVAYAARFS